MPQLTAESEPGRIGPRTLWLGGVAILAGTVIGFIGGGAGGA